MSDQTSKPRVRGSPPEEGATAYLPARRTLPSLRAALPNCRGCALYRDATQAVFGEGAAHAPLFIVGEQPGNDEDLAGAPFVGPAGRVLDSALQQAGIDRGQTYVTNVVKHFKFERAGTRRLHKRPGAREIAACAPWIDAELEVVRPRILVCLGATAAQALLGRDFRVTARRGQLVPTAYADTALATIHPSAVLRQQSRQARHRSMLDLVADLRVAAEELARVTGPG